MTSGTPVTVAFGAATHVGLRRSINEDAYLAASPVFLVADGMGGHDAGDVASRIVVDEFDRLRGRESVSVDDLQRCLATARRRVDSLRSGPRAAGTTLSGIALADVDGEGYWLTINLGDSRTYRWARGALEQISIDHSVVQELLDSGSIDLASAARDRRRNVITRAIGAGSDGEADFWMLPAEAGDRILVCSDGLSGELDAERIAVVLTAEADPQRAADRLVHEAVVNGGRDNVTALVIDALSVATRAGDGVFDTAPSHAHIDTDTRPRAAAGGS